MIDFLMYVLASLIALLIAVLMGIIMVYTVQFVAGIRTLFKKDGDLW